MKKITFKELAEQCGYYPARLARELHYSPSAVGKWFLGIATPPIQIILQLSTILKIDCEYLLESLIYSRDKYNEEHS